jgi:two-component system chemotaxis response regulator CheY
VKRVLVVEDDADIRSAVALVLEEEGYAIDEASDGMGALDRLNRDPLPNVILLDLMMPGMDGASFLKVKKFDRRIAAIPVVVMTAYYRSAPALDGVRIVLSKPLQPAALLDALRQVS